VVQWSVEGDRVERARRDYLDGQALPMSHAPIGAL